MQDGEHDKNQSKDKSNFVPIFSHERNDMSYSRTNNVVKYFQASTLPKLGATLNMHSGTPPVGATGLEPGTPTMSR